MSSEGMEKRIELLAMILNSAAFRELDCHAQYVKMKKHGQVEHILRNRPIGVHELHPTQGSNTDEAAQAS